MIEEDTAGNGSGIRQEHRCKIDRVAAAGASWR
jgi:hypothetical protein